MPLDITDMFKIAIGTAEENSPRKTPNADKGKKKGKNVEDKIKKVVREVAETHEKTKMTKKGPASTQKLLVSVIGKNFCDTAIINAYINSYVPDPLVRFQSINNTETSGRSKVTLTGVSLVGKEMTLEFHQTNSQLAFDLYHDGRLTRSTTVDGFNRWVDSVS